MLKKKITSAILVFMLASPLALLSTSANAHHKYRYHHYYCNCAWLSGMPLVYKIVRELRASPATYDQGIYVSARGHQVELSGFVGTASQKRTALDIARYTCGVSVVWDNLRLQAP